MRAERIGLVEECVEQGQALGVALRLAAQVARQSPAAVHFCKELIQGGRDQPINTLLARERERLLICLNWKIPLKALMPSLRSDRRSGRDGDSGLTRS